MKYIYHYHATVQMEAGSLTHIDGILTADSRVDSMDRYREVKTHIAGYDKLPADRMVICSLSLLHSI